MSDRELIQALRRYARQYKSGETLGRCIDGTEDLMEEAAKRLDHYKKLEQGGLLVELPVKMGQTVYLPGGAEARVTSYYHCEDGFRNLWLTIETGGCRRRQCIYSCDIGKDAFLTREEAMKAKRKGV